MNQTLIEEFISRLIVEKKIVGVSDAVLSQMKTDLYQRVEDLINASILRRVPQTKLGEFQDVLETGSDEDVQKFCKEIIPDIDSVVAQTLLSFRNTYLGLTRA
jgi:hypothetical protein